MERFRRVFVVVVDSFGIGNAPDAAAFDDLGSDTLGHIDERMESFRIPNMIRLGLADLHPGCQG